MFGLAVASCLTAACTSSHDVASGWERGAPRSTESPAPTPARPTPGTTRVPTGTGPDLAPPSSGRGGDPDDYIFSQDDLRNYEIEVDPADWARINEEAYLEEYIKGRLRFEGTDYVVGVRFKGFRGSLYGCFEFDDTGQATERTCSRLPIKLGFDEYDENARFFGLKKLNFHVLRNDRSLMRDRIAYFVFRAFGVPAPRAVHATLSVNGEPLGLFALVEEIDGRFTRHAYDEGGEGNIYKERWPTLSTDPAYYRSGLESNRDMPDVSAMVDFAEALQTADPSNIERILREHTNFDAIMRYLAVDRAINHWDGPLAFRCRPNSEVPPLPPKVELAQRPALGWEVCQNKNYYWYEESESGKLWLVPWDMDVTFNSFSQFPDWETEPDRCPIQHQGRPPRCDRLVDLFATALRPEYERVGRELLTTGPLRHEILSKLIASWYEQIAPYSDPFSNAIGSFLLNGEIDARIRSFAAEMSLSP